MVSTLEQMQLQNGTGPGVRRSKRPLLASRTRCNVLWTPPKFGNKVEVGNTVQFGNKFANWCNVWSIECVIVYGHVPECNWDYYGVKKTTKTNKWQDMQLSPLYKTCYFENSERDWRVLDATDKFGTVCHGMPKSLLAIVSSKIEKVPRDIRRA